MWCVLVLGFLCDAWCKSWNPKVAPIFTYILVSSSNGACQMWTNEGSKVKTRRFAQGYAFWGVNNVPQNLVRITPKSRNFGGINRTAKHEQQKKIKHYNSLSGVNCLTKFVKNRSTEHCVRNVQIVVKCRILQC